MLTLTYIIVLDN